VTFPPFFSLFSPLTRVCHVAVVCAFFANGCDSSNPMLYGWSLHEASFRSFRHLITHTHEGPVPVPEITSASPWRAKWHLHDLRPDEIPLAQGDSLDSRAMHCSRRLEFLRKLLPHNCAHYPDCDTTSDCVLPTRVPSTPLQN
jgi:hypothetical protein